VTGEEGSPNNWEAQKGLLLSVDMLVGSQSVSDKHCTGSAMLKNELADKVLSCIELFRTRATSNGCMSLNKVQAVMMLGPEPWGSMAQSYDGRGRPSSSIRTGTLASCLAGTIQSAATTTWRQMPARCLRWTFIVLSPKVTVPLAKSHWASCFSSQSLPRRKSSTLLHTDTSASNAWPSITNGITVSHRTSRLALLAA